MSKDKRLKRVIKSIELLDAEAQAERDTQIIEQAICDTTAHNVAQSDMVAAIDTSIDKIDVSETEREKTLAAIAKSDNTECVIISELVDAVATQTITQNQVYLDRIAELESKLQAAQIAKSVKIKAAPESIRTVVSCIPAQVREHYDTLLSRIGCAPVKNLFGLLFAVVLDKPAQPANHYYAKVCELSAAYGFKFTLAGCQLGDVSQKRLTISHQQIRTCSQTKRNVYDKRNLYFCAQSAPVSSYQKANSSTTNQSNFARYTVECRESLYYVIDGRTGQPVEVATE